MTLDAARAVIASDAPRALALLIDVWRDTRDPALADLIDRVSHFTARPMDIVFPSSRRHHYMRWHGRFAAGDLCDLPALLITWRWHAHSSFEYLARWPDDPRVARHAAENLTPYQAEHGVALLARLADPRTRDKLRAAGPPWSEIEIPDHVPVDPQILAEIDAELARAVATAAADRAERAARFGRVYDSPSDLAERAVLADWLLERDDPRGEFITLQLAKPTRESSRRAKQLLRDNRRAFLGDIRPAIFGGRFQFANGFLDSCSIDVRYVEDAEHAREWATLREVSLEHDGDRGRTFAPMLPRLLSLEALHGMGDDTLHAVVGGVAPTLRNVTFDPERIRIRDRELVGLPNLRTLTLVRTAPSSWLVGGPAWNRVERIRITADITRAGDWFGAFTQARCVQLDLWDHSEWTLQFRRPAHLSIRHHPSLGWRFDQRDQRAVIVQALRSLPAQSFDTVRIRTTLEGLDQEVARLRRR